MVDAKDREVCLCFHITVGKIEKFHRNHHPRHSSCYAECYGAGTGCGWCIPFLEKIHEQIEVGEPPRMKLDAEEYQRRRLEYHKTKKPQLPPPGEHQSAINLDVDSLLDDIPDDLKFD